MIFLIVGVVLMLCICVGIFASIPKGSTGNTQLAAIKTDISASQTSQPAQAATTAPTKEPSPTNTTGPTNTPKPTDTPIPTPTSTPVPEPEKHESTGDKVVDLDWTGIGILKIEYSGGGNFAVWAFNQDDEKDLIVNTIGKYSGTRPLNFLDGEKIGRLQIESSGPWTIEVDPLAKEYAHTMAAPGTTSGKGDDVVFVIDGNPDIAKITNKGEGNFAVWSIAQRRDLIVNEIGNYEGEIVLDKNVAALIVESDGNWTIALTAK